MDQRERGKENVESRRRRRGEKRMLTVGGEGEGNVDSRRRKRGEKRMLTVGGEGEGK